MNTIHIRRKLIGTAIAAAATPTLLFLGAGTAQAIQDVSEAVPGITVGAINPQPDTGQDEGIGDPGVYRPEIEAPGVTSLAWCSLTRVRPGCK